MLGEKHHAAEECFSSGCIAAGFLHDIDLKTKLYEEFRTFNKEFIPVYLESRPGKTRIGAGLACGALWMVCVGIRKGDMVLSPDGSGKYCVGEVVGDYYYEPERLLPHRRPVKWADTFIDRADMSEALRRSVTPMSTVRNISHHQNEIENLVGNITAPKLFSSDSTVEDPLSFALEEHLEEFLMKNWEHTELGKEYDIYEEDGEKAQQYRTDTGPLDILAISKDKKILLVVELKKGRASDAVVGQTLRYMSYVQDELAEAGQSVRGVIIAHEDDHRIRRALAMTKTIDFYRYDVRFKLVN